MSVADAVLEVLAAPAARAREQRDFRRTHRPPPCGYLDLRLHGDDATVTVELDDEPPL